MSVLIQVAGPVLVSIAAPDASPVIALATLGYTIAGPQIREVQYGTEVFTDEDGGTEGPEVDEQYFGQIDIVTMMFTKYDAVQMAKLMASYPNAISGTPGTPGTVIGQSGLNWRLLLNSTNFVRNYTNVRIREPREHNQGTKHTTMIIVAKCKKNRTTGLLWNTTTT